MNPLSQQELYDAIQELTDRIEACGASTALTHAVILSSDIARATGDVRNPHDPCAADRVRAALRAAGRDYIRKRHA